MKNQKIYDGYKKKAGFLLNFQLCRAYIGENCKKVTDAVEAILLHKFRGEIDTSDPDTYKAFTSKIRATQGKEHAVVELPLQGYKETVGDTLAWFVANRFDKMVEAVKISLGQYPLTFRDIIEQAEAQRYIEQSS
jgi:hypothetical protein